MMPTGASLGILRSFTLFSILVCIGNFLMARRDIPTSEIFVKLFMHAAEQHTILTIVDIPTDYDKGTFTFGIYILRYPLDATSSRRD